MSNNPILELGLTPPPGVAFIQWGDGTIRIRYAPKDVVALREMLLGLARQLTAQAIQKLEQERAAEIERQKMPMSRLESLTKELHGLRSETVELEPFDAQKFERSHTPAESPIPPAPVPIVVVSKVVRETADAE